MRILHTSDWHLGKKLERFSRLEEQQSVLSEICDIADFKSVDAIVIAGDIFDSFNPPVEAIELFFRTLHKLSSNAHRPVIVIAGNHDSADRIEAPDPLARELGIVFVGYPNSKIKPFELESGLSLINSAEGFLEFKLPNKEFLRIILTPYANQQRIKHFLGIENPEQELRNILAQSWKTIANKYCNKQGVNILLSHLFFAKKGAKQDDNQSQEPDDEKPILHIGGAQIIYSDAIPEQIQYSALGHLHRKQIVDNTNGPVVYCGTPIAYSFSENNQQKYIAIADIKANQKAHINFIELHQGKKLLRNKFDSVELALQWLKENKDALVEITLEMETYLKMDEKKSLFDSHNGIVNIIPKVKIPQGESLSKSQTINLNDDLADLFKQFFASRNANQQPNNELIDLLNEVIK